jgi:hypothetical protein
MTLATEKGSSPAQTLGQVRDLAADAGDLAAEARSTLRQIEALLEDQVRTRPYRTLLIAAGAGYVLGGGLASSLTREAIRLALRTMGPSMLAATLFQNATPTVANRKKDFEKAKEKQNDTE